MKAEKYSLVIVTTSNMKQYNNQFESSLVSKYKINLNLILQNAVHFNTVNENYHCIYFNLILLICINKYIE